MLEIVTKKLGWKRIGAIPAELIYIKCNLDYFVLFFESSSNTFLPPSFEGSNSTDFE